MDDLGGKAPESGDIIRGSLGILLMKNKRGLRDGATMSTVPRPTLGMEGARSTIL